MNLTQALRECAEADKKIAAQRATVKRYLIDHGDVEEGGFVFHLKRSKIDTYTVAPHYRVRVCKSKV